MPENLRPGYLREPVKKRHGGLATFLVLLAVILFGGILWYAYPSRQDADAPVPVIHADKEPFRVKPSDPGGLDVPHRESTVFEVLDDKAKDAEAKVENLLEMTEEPMDRDALLPEVSKVDAKLDSAALEAAIEEKDGEERVVATEKTAVEPVKEIVRKLEDTKPDILLPLEGTDPVEVVTKVEKVVEETKEEITKDVAKQVVKAKEIVEKAPVIEKKPVPAPVVETPKKAPEPKPEIVKEAVKEEPKEAIDEIAALLGEATPIVEKTAPPKDGWLVQLGSLASHDDATKHWRVMKATYPKQLGNLALKVEEVAVKGKTYYRVQGGYVSKSRAKEICDVMKRKSQGGCFVVESK